MNKSFGTGQDVTKVVDDRSPMAKAMSRVSEIIACCLLMIVPALIGYWVDQKLSTRILFTFAGLLFGMTGAVLQLRRLVSSTNKTYEQSKSKEIESTDEAGRQN